ncbi:cellulase family glycosylhydrolase [Umezawaea beigongshangensis]|uniref:cellulase family glycosylhydrolase n=1 Tax=Umezawaea beigongshangensis TaxID=2780383 RepID=UPI0018F17EC5|nr:cellulase family glycosylhydrolase [Umezawaea beigongshangensis]
MRTRSALVAIGALLLSLFTAPHAHAATGFTVSDGRLLDANGDDFVMRGVNHAHTWYPTQTSSFANVKALGANTVRVVLATGKQWTKNDTADVANVVSLCKQNRLICVLEAHDTTGYGEQSAAASLSEAADYWLSVKSALIGQEKYVIVNIGNEPFGNTGYAAWASDTSAAIAKLRGGGLTHTIVVDAPNWGQDWTFTMRDNAPAVFASDPQRNTMFSIHMYGVFDTAAEVTAYLDSFVSRGLPILVGEFGHDHSDGNPDEDAILAAAQSLRLGYLGWSWSGNGGGVEYLDMTTNFGATSLTPWGQRIVNGVNGIRATSREASVYSGGTNDTTAPTAPGTPTASSVTSSGVVLSWAASTDAVGVTGYDVVRISGSTETPVTSSGTGSASVTGLSASTTYVFAVYARDAAGNRSARSGTTSVTTSANSGTGACTVTYTVSGQWQGGFQGGVSIGNTGSSPVNGWTLRWSFPSGQTITSIWGGTASGSGAEVTVTNAPYTATIPAGGSTSFGFTAAHGGTNTAPTAFTLNGSACSVG